MNERLAFDRASVRTYDVDGRLHVSIAHISKATINPYYGKEIPNAESLGLDAETVYQLLRDPEELRKAASTFNNIQLMLRHIPVNASEPQKEWIVGSTGTDAAFNAPYLDNSLVIWDAVGIAGIESKEQQELSCGYRYEADMTPGVYEGQNYDGVMRNIIGNHVALVEVGRAGSDVVVGDSQLLEPSMKTKLSRKALVVRGALKAYFLPKLAQDAQLGDLSELVKNVQVATYAKTKPALLKAVQAHVKGKLAADADMSDLAGLLDAFAGEDDMGEDDDDPEKTNKPGVAADDKSAQVLAMLKGKLSDEDFAAISAMLTGAADGDFPPKTEGTPGEPKDKDKEPKGMDSAAVDKAIKQAKQDTILQMNAIREAEKAVLPHIGEVSGLDSAEAVYKLALDHAKVDVSGVDASAYKAMVRMLPLHKKPVIAQDSGSSAFDEFKKEFPGAVVPGRG